MQAEFGLPSIRHQLSLFGGHMNIATGPGKGTHVVLTMQVVDSNT